MKEKEVFSSNEIRLSWKDWLITGIILAFLFALIPRVWQRIEPFDPGPGYRISYALSEDYWHFSRYCRIAATEDRVLVVGDSVMWGEYVTPDETLPEQLNARVGETRFANLGVNGIHPIAMAGLIDYYGRALSNRDIVLHYNPLWMCSPRHDLQTEKEFRFNHPQLVPQFYPRIPCYKDPYAERLGIVFGRYLPMRGWANHLAIAYFDNMDIPAWTLEHPIENPFSKITLELPQPDMARRHGGKSWTEAGMAEQRFEWVDPAVSLQWHFFQRTVQTLKARGDNVFVLVGPFNEHMIAPDNRETYVRIKKEIAAWLDQEAIPHYMAPLLPSELYGDASHPLSEGYALLAANLLDEGVFQQFLTKWRGL